MNDFFFIASRSPEAERAKFWYTQRYGQAPRPEKARVLFALGGDGCLIRTARLGLDYEKPVFGINYGHRGFLVNPQTPENLYARLEKAEPFDLGALEAQTTDREGRTAHAFAINEVFVCRRHPQQAVHLRVLVDGQAYLPRLEGDGIILATAVGSTGYSNAAGGPVVSLRRDVLLATPNNPCFPRARPSPLVLDPCEIVVDVQDGEDRPADVYADVAQVAGDIVRLKVKIDPKRRFRLLFDPGYDHRRRALQAHWGDPGLGG